MLLSAGCATAVRQERSFRFPSNLTADAALRCVTTRLRVEDFDVVDQRPDTAIALREDPARSVESQARWSRVRVTTSRNDVGGTIVESVAGSGRSREGPFEAPDLPLQEVVGRLTAACTWP
jgi:hypothetical protein